MGHDNSNPDTASALYASQSLFHPPCHVVRLSLLRGKEPLSVKLCPWPVWQSRLVVAGTQDGPMAPGKLALSGASGSEPWALVGMGLRHVTPDVRLLP